LVQVKIMFLPYDKPKTSYKVPLWKNPIPMEN
jgi:hypothetical protein